jgi:hypothetical protein
VTENTDNGGGEMQQKMRIREIPGTSKVSDARVETRRAMANEFLSYLERSGFRVVSEADAPLDKYTLEGFVYR